MNASCAEEVGEVSLAFVPPPVGFNDSLLETKKSPRRKSYRRSTNRMSVPREVHLEDTDVTQVRKPEPEVLVGYSKSPKAVEMRSTAEARKIAAQVSANLDTMVRNNIGVLSSAVAVKFDVDKVVSRFRELAFCSDALAGYMEDTGGGAQAENDYMKMWRTASAFRDENKAWNAFLEKVNACAMGKSSLASVLNVPESDHQATLAEARKLFKNIKDLDDLVAARRARLRERVAASKSFMERNNKFFAQKADSIKAELTDQDT